MKPLSDQSLVSIICRVTEMMAGIRFQPSPERLDSIGAPWRMVMLPLVGGTPIEIALSASDSACGAIAASVFRCKASEVDAAMIHDSLGELLNMAAGQIKSIVAPHLALGLPKVRDDDEQLDLSGWRKLLLASGPHRLLVAIGGAR